MTDMQEPPPTPWERFVQLYGTPERVAAMWDQWIATQTPTSAAFLEKIVAEQAEANQEPLEVTKRRLVLEKLVEDRGTKFVEKFLREHEQTQKTLKPLVLTRKKR
jgi:hypothetical protein